MLKIKFPPLSAMFPPRSVSAPVPKGEEVEKEAAGAVGGRDQENTGWNKKSQIVSSYKNSSVKESRVYAKKT